jgi:hypothetical protein
MIIALISMTTPNIRRCMLVEYVSYKYSVGLFYF